MSKRRLLLDMLSDGRFHSGELLGEQLGITRTAVWKLMQKITELGLKVDAITGRGYRLSHPVELLQEQQIVDWIHPDAGKLLSGIELGFEVDSTNTSLMRNATALGSGYALLAEMQSQGRGRRGRHWVSPFGANIYLSLLWRFEEGSSRLSGLSLVIAVALARVFESLGAKDLSIKWPNDLLADGRKLAGILIDVAGESDGPCHVVVGVGVNHAMPPEAAAEIDQPWSDLASAGVGAGRNQIAGMLLNELLLTLEQFQNSSLEPFMQDWQRLDATYGQNVLLYLPKSTISGIGRGVDSQGLLLIETPNGVDRYASGEVSLRIQE